MVYSPASSLDSQHGSWSLDLTSFCYALLGRPTQLLSQQNLHACDADLTPFDRRRLHARSGSRCCIRRKGFAGASLFLGIVLLLISAPVHLPIEFGLHVSVWADYPAWYHFTFLLPLAPLTVLGGMLATVNFKKKI